MIKIADTWNSYLYLKTTKPKKRKKQDTENHWMSTPGWWVNMFMNKPQRRATKLWEQNFSNKDIPTEDDIDYYDTPSVSRKPHIYYW